MSKQADKQNNKSGECKEQSGEVLKPHRQV